MKVCSNGPDHMTIDHMTKMAATTIYCKNLLKISRTRRPMTLGIVALDIGPSKFVQMMILS